jgi:hypothetical protein
MTDALRYQAFVQLRDVALDGVTHWHSLCRPASSEALARAYATHWIRWRRLGELCDVGAQRSDPFPSPRGYFVADAPHDGQWIRIAIIHVYEKDAVAHLAKIPDDAVVYLEAYPPSVDVPMENDV